MTDMTNLRDSRNSDEAVKSAIRSVFAALSADYGNLFLSQFKRFGAHKYTPTTWKWRLYKRLHGCSAESIYNGYEGLVVAMKGQGMPTMDQIVTAIKDEHRHSQPVLPGPEQAPLDRSAATKERRLGELAQFQEYMKQRPEWLKADGSVDEKARLKRLRAAVASHEALLAEHVRLGKIPPPRKIATPCAFPGCPNSGTRTTSVSGSSRWYCRKHYKP